MYTILSLIPYPFYLYVSVVMVTHTLRPIENINKKNSFKYPQTVFLTRSQNVCFNLKIPLFETPRSFHRSKDRHNIEVFRNIVTTVPTFCTLGYFLRSVIRVQSHSYFKPSQSSCTIEKFNNH
jgi:hypothetical protein